MTWLCRSLHTIVLASLCLMAAAVTVDAADPGVVVQEDLFTTAPFRECHASTLAQTPRGLVAAWFGGTREKDPDVGIWVARQIEGAWAAPVEVANGVQYGQVDGYVLRYPCWNPVLFQMPDGPLLLFYKVGPSPSTWWGMLTESTDAGQTWSQPRRLPEGISGPVKNKPILLKDGRLLCPTSTEDQGWRVHFEWTADDGRAWRRTPPLSDAEKISAIQPSILQHSDGTLQAIGRTQNGRLFSTTSTDQGLSWAQLSLLNLPNPNSGTDAVTLADGRHVLVYNHTAKGRSPLNVALSRDGQSWDAVATLESEPGEYSYPAVIATDDGLVHITYTWKRQRIRHVVLDPQKTKAVPIVNGEWPEPR